VKIDRQADDTVAITWHQPFPITPPGPAQPGALASVSRFRDQLDVFWIAPDGSVATTFWTVG
jgi:hypothetical protein